MNDNPTHAITRLRTHVATHAIDQCSLDILKVIAAHDTLRRERDNLRRAAIAIETLYRVERKANNPVSCKMYNADTEANLAEAWGIT